MAKIGRNAPCPCGSGKKYKKCHGAVLGATPAVVAQARRAEAEDNALRAQGIFINISRPVIWNGRKVWALGNKVYPNRRPDETFHEFIIEVLRTTLGQEWWGTQLARPDGERHFIIRCYERFLAWKQSKTTPEKRVSAETWAALPDGWSRALLALAWDVASLDHAAHIPARTLDRLRDRNEYQGARYEIAIAAIFARLGCDITFLDEGSMPPEQHCEFLANYRGASIAVEVKSRHRAGVLHTPGTIDPNRLFTGRGIEPLLNQALRQQPGDRPFLIFVDVNAPPTPDVPLQDKPWFRYIWRMMDKRAAPTPAEPDPFNAIFFTNYSYHYETENEVAFGDPHLSIISKYPRHPIPGDSLLEMLRVALNHYGNVPNIPTQP